MSISTLRGLAKAYSDSIIDRKQYIHRRRELIDDIVAGKAEIVPYQSHTASGRPKLDRTFSDREDTLELPMIDEHPTERSIGPKSNGSRKMMIAVLIVGMSLIGWIVFQPKQTPIQTPIVATAPAPAIALDDTSRAELTEFLNNNKWQNKHLTALTTLWLAKDISVRQIAAEHPIVHQITDSVGQKFREETALLELGDRDEVLARQRLLLDLGKALSPHSERLQRLEEEWQASNLGRAVTASSGPASTVADSAQPSESRLLASNDATQDSTNVALSSSATSADDVDAHDDAIDVAPVQNSEMADPIDLDEIEVEVPEKETNTVALQSSPEEFLESESADVTAATESGALIVESPTLTQTPSVDVIADAPTVALPSGENKVIPDVKPLQKTVAKQPSGVKKSLCRAALAKRRRPYCHDTLDEETNGPQLTVLPVGTFNMGGKTSEERPQRTINIDHPFAVSIYEISQREFEFYCQATRVDCPSQPWNDANFPVVNVTWEMASDYARWLSSITNATYRLPSESEWEYAARGGTDTPYPFGDEILPTHARFSFRGAQETPLASNDRSVNRNKFRLFHMVGNVQEWVQDTWNDNYAGAPTDTSARLTGGQEKVVRGGSFRDGPEKIRSASRTYLAAGNANITTGFRIVREVD